MKENTSMKVVKSTGTRRFECACGDTSHLLSVTHHSFSRIYEYSKAQPVPDEDVYIEVQVESKSGTKSWFGSFIWRIKTALVLLITGSVSMSYEMYLSPNTKDSEDLSTIKSLANWLTKIYDNVTYNLSLIEDANNQQ